MKNALINTAIFVAGAAIGSLVTWKLVKTKYEQIAQEEIESVKEVFSRRQKEEEVSIAHSNVNKDKPSLTEYAQKLSEEGYTSYADMATQKEEEEEDDDMNDKPYVISPEQFDEHPDYEKRSLTYFNDKVLADDDDEVIEDVDALIGLDSLNHFGEYEDDSVFVRDDVLKCDYEILLDLRNYSDLYWNPHQVDE